MAEELVVALRLEATRVDRLKSMCRLRWDWLVPSTLLDSTLNSLSNRWSKAAETSLAELRCSLADASFGKGPTWRFGAMSSPSPLPNRVPFPLRPDAVSSDQADLAIVRRTARSPSLRSPWRAWQIGQVVPQATSISIPCHPPTNHSPLDSARERLKVFPRPTAITTPRTTSVSGSLGRRMAICHPDLVRVWSHCHRWPRIRPRPSSPAARSRFSVVHLRTD
jgi:hypothetical protein